MFAYVLIDVSGARGVNNICSSQMRSLPLMLLMLRIRNWLNLFLKHCTLGQHGNTAGFHTPLVSACLSGIFSLPFPHILFSYQYCFFVPLFSLPCCLLIFPHILSATLSSSLPLIAIFSHFICVHLPS